MADKRMERAIFLRSAAQAPEILGRASRFYIGDEFCERRLPSERMLEELRRIGVMKGGRITLVTPPLGEGGVAGVGKIIARLSDIIKGGFEVVVNDWGLFGSLSRRPRGLELVLGRVLSAPYARTGRPGGKAHPKALLRALAPFPFLRPCAAPGGCDPREMISDEFSEPFLRFLLDNRVKAVEFNFIRHLLAVRGQFRKNSLKAHLYWPWSFLSWTRFCPCAAGFKGDARKSLGGCRRECDKTYGVARLGPDVEIIMRGNAYLIPHGRIESAAGLPVDRLIEDGLF